MTSGLGALLPNEGMTAQRDLDRMHMTRPVSCQSSTETRHLCRRHPGLLPGMRLGTGTGAGRGPGWSGGVGRGQASGWVGLFWGTCDSSYESTERGFESMFGISKFNGSQTKPRRLMGTKVKSSS